MSASKILGFVSILSLSLFSLASPTAAGPAISFTSVTASYTDGAGRNIGWEFTPNANLSVSRLGFFDDGGDGLNTDHDVAIYTGAGSLVTSGNVAAGTLATLSGGFRWVDVSPITLNAGQLYVIDALNTASGDPWAWNGGIAGVDLVDLTVADFLQVGAPGSARYNCCSETAIAFPATSIGDNRYLFVGANFDATAIPEPASALVLAGGLIVLSLGRRLRQGI